VDLPAQFEWPSDQVAQRAFALTKLAPGALLSAPGSGDLVEVVDAVLLEGRHPIAFRLIDRVAVNFAGADPGDRRRAAELLLTLCRRGSLELRASFFAVAAKRLGDALELETTPRRSSAWPSAPGPGSSSAPPRATGTWPRAWPSRSVAVATSAAARRRRASTRSASACSPRSSRTARRAPLRDDRGRLAAGAAQAARVIEGMGAVAVDRLVRALKQTGAPAVEAFLIDMLAALAPESEAALQREVTPFAPGEATCRLLRAAASCAATPRPCSSPPSRARTASCRRRP